MKPNRRLQVKKVRRYRAARYPSHQEPDPTRSPAPVPFPFARGIVAAAAASLGLAAGLGAEDREAPPPRNPFALEFSGLPYRTSPFGTGAPRRIEEEQARGIIERVFREAGYQLAGGVTWKKDALSFAPTGYDEQKKVGYLWATSRTLDDDAVISWRNEGKEVAAEDPLRLSMAEAKHLEEKAPADKEFIAVISAFDSRFAYEAWGEETAAEMQEAAKIADPAKRAVAQRLIQEKAAKQALETLERCVREYISWARSQGAP